MANPLAMVSILESELPKPSADSLLSVAAGVDALEVGAAEVGAAEVAEDWLELEAAGVLEPPHALRARAAMASGAASVRIFFCMVPP